MAANYLEKICLIHCKEKTCRFISLIMDGFYCVKDTPVASILSEKAINKEIVAQEDNCEGIKK